MKRKHAFAGDGLKVGAFVGAITIIGHTVLETLPHFRPGDFPLGVAIQFGVALTIVGLQWDIFTIVKETTEARNRANILMESLEIPDFKEDELVSLCESAAGIFGQNALPKFVRDDVQDTISALSNDLSELLHKSSRQLDGGRLVGCLNALSEMSSISILATSAIEGVDYSFWDSDEGLAYLTIQAHQKKRHPEMILRRIFLVDRLHDLDSTANKRGLVKVIEQHEAAGFEVGVWYEGGFKDFVVFDEKYIVYSERGTEGNDAAGGLVCFEAESTKEATSKFRQRWQVAVESRKKLDLRGKATA